MLNELRAASRCETEQSHAMCAAGFAASAGRVHHSALPTPQQILAQRRRARKSRRAKLLRRLGVLAVLLAVPALAAETAFEPQIPRAPAPAVQPMGFETPGESFPGSAFYYLEDAPIAEPLGPATADLSPNLAVVPAAALVASGSGTDMVRAQECLATAIYYEAASESEAGQRAVAQVVLNRVAHGAWPSTVCGVVYQGSARHTGCQFTFTCDGSLARRPSRAGWERASRIAHAALAGAVYRPVGLSTHYHTLAVRPYWAPGLTQTAVIGAHVFYRWPGVAGERAAFSFAYGGGEPSPPSAAMLSDEPALVALATPLAIDPGPAEPPAAEIPGQDFAAPELAAPAAARLESSGRVRSEYVNSGRWIARP